jgi:photosystem II stability/assembly factor-like uncharacterized protein
MRIPEIFLSVIIVICFFSFQSCKKSSDSILPPGPDPIKPDTLSAGWTKKNIAGEENLGDIFFNSSTNGFLVGSKIYKSTDGGNNWLAVSTTSGMINTFMTNDGKAFFTNTSNAVFKTIDGGSSFTSNNFPDVPIDIFFIDNTKGYFVTQHNGFYSTSDAGQTWSTGTVTGLPSIPGYTTLSCFDNTTGWIANPIGVYKSMGTFSQWQQSVINGGLGGGNFTSVFAVSALDVYVANANAEIFRSTDGGNNFSLVKKLEGGGLTDIHFLNSQVGYASVGRNIFKTTDAGVNWSKVVSLGQGALSELHFTDANHGWACGDSTVLIFKQ